MSVVQFLLGRREFKTIKEIKEVIRDSKNFRQDIEDPSGADALLIFQTSKQQTWLIATRERLYCVLDDINKLFTKVQWSIGRNKIIRDGHIIINISTREYKENTVLLDIGDRTDWLLSKKLFPTEKATDKICQMVRNKME